MWDMNWNPKLTLKYIYAFTKTFFEKKKKTVTDVKLVIKCQVLNQACVHKHTILNKFKIR